MLEQFINLLVDEPFDRPGCLFTLEQFGNVFGQPVLQSRYGVENWCARLRWQRIDKRRISPAKEILGVRSDEVFNFALKKACFKQGVKYGLLRNKLVAYSIADGLGQPFTMTRNHPL